ncbi:MAG TPA: IPT/TIG domain-containing protein [Jatrophihabitans sp.]|nr:IPT/TIG domain-containing protein [Jatrophihabitans sp.]
MALAITSFTPTTGSTVGGTTVTITGTALDTVDVVLVGNKQAAIVGTPTATTLVFKTPAGAAGNAAVHVIDSDTDTEVNGPVPFVYAAPAVQEVLVSTGARKWKLDVDISAAQDGTEYIPVRAMSDFQPSNPSTMQDDSDYDSDGFGSDAKTGSKWANVLKLIRKKGVTSNVYDPGQETLRLASNEFGGAGVVRVRWYERDGGGEAWEGYAQVQWSEDGGNSTALSTVSVTLSGQGARTPITNPAA